MSTEPADAQTLSSIEDVSHPSIPAELQIQIFAFACTDSDINVTDILRFTRVCRSWRHVIYNAPEFWTRLRLDWEQYCKGARADVVLGKASPVQEWIARAGSHALAIDIHNPYLVYNSENPAVELLRDPLVFPMHRLRELSISLNMVQRLPESIVYGSQVLFPSLEVLQLDEPVRESVIWGSFGRYPRTRTRAVQMFRHSPLLRTVVLDVAPARMSTTLNQRLSLPWQSLQRLELCLDHSSHAGWTLEACTSVTNVKLKLSQLRNNPTLDDDEPPTCTLPSVRTFTLDAHSAFPTDFLRMVAMPNLASFALIAHYSNMKRIERWPNGTWALTRFIGRAPLIRSLVLRQSGFENEGGLYASQHLPLLEEITLKWRATECPSWRITDELCHSGSCPNLRRIILHGVQPMDAEHNQGLALFLAGIPALVQARLALAMVRLQHVEVSIRNCSVEDVKKLNWCKELMALANDKLRIDIVQLEPEAANYGEVPGGLKNLTPAFEAGVF
ncbi:uncharacterized protein SCHCODRAFT_02633777 [Schizophyllum commune H4-8]|nr:uncharacterized protein SCHCODRAFT_02633777 [Schizophyllum commune H4-8]KAI5889185.1 hypothetical protein SCHCODRAFT_02633777 [Schizophyllum commune H4-8]